MNKIEQMHMDVLETTVSFVDWRFSDTGKAAASKSAEITEQIAVEFYEWCDTSAEADLFWRRNRVDLDMNGSHNDKIREKRRLLFQEFLKTKQ